jgi:hypothetical protein
VYLSFIGLSLFLIELDKSVKFDLFLTFDLEFNLEFVLQLGFLMFELSFQLRHFSLGSFLGPIKHGLPVLQHIGMLVGIIIPLF